ncbi:MAG: hypothetical protein ACRD96_16600, partial [Bryobacteraceae bacterium]
ALPVAALAGWLAFLYHSTGHLFGSAEFTGYNARFLLHPVRAVVALAKRIGFLFFENFHWIGTWALIVSLRARAPAQRTWKIAGSLVAAHIAVFSVLGGAMLERYLLPVLPIVYTAMAASFTGRAGPLALAAGLIAGNFWNKPSPFPLENNLAMVDFVRLHQTAAGYIDSRPGSARITTVWPLTSALERPEFGYVQRPRRVEPIPDFSRETVLALPKGSVEVLILYSRQWEPRLSLMNVDLLRRFWQRFFGYHPQIDPREAGEYHGLQQVAGWRRRGQWIEVWAKPPLL